MKNKIEKKLKLLIGLEFAKSTRTGATECLQFGISHKINRKGEKIQMGEYDIHLQCPWRITKDYELLLGSDDVAEQPNEDAEYDENFDWDIQGGNLRDIKMVNFLNSGKYIVESVKADNFGGFELNFNSNIKLTIFPTGSSKNFYNEYWRLLDNRDENKNHFVVTPFGIDE